MPGWSVVVLSTFIFAPCVLAGESVPQKLSLDDAIKIALQQHPSLRRTESLSLAARARVTQAKSAFYPFIDFGGSVSTGPAGAPALGLRGLAGTPLKSHYGGSMNVTQILYDFGKTQHSTARAQSLFEASAKRSDVQKAWVILSTHEAYYNVLLAQQLVYVAEAAVQQREQTLRQATANFEAGLKSRVDVRFAEVELSKAQAKLSETKNNLEAAFASLNNALGVTEQKSYQLEETTRSAEGPEPLDRLIDASLSRRPELQESAAHVHAAKEAIEFARSEKRPTLLGVTSFGRVHPPKFLRNPKQRDVYALGFAVTFPIFTGGRIEGEIREAQENLDAQQAAREELAQNIRLQVTRAHVNLQTQKENLRAAEQQVKAAEDALNLANLRYKNNLSDIVELTQAQLAHTDALTARAVAFYNVKIAEATLAYAVGAYQEKY